MSSNYKKKNKTVYFKGKSIPNSDPETFIEVCDQVPNVSYFAYDKNQVYADGGAREGLQILEDVDTASLVLFEDKSFFTDRFHLFYFNWYFIEYANTQTHQELKETLRHNQPDIDAWWNRDETFYQALDPLSDDYYTDGNRVYYFFDKDKSDAALRSYDYPYFFTIGDYKSYFSEISQGDQKTFNVLNEYYACDNNHIYHTFRAINADHASFEVIAGHFAKDKDTVWYGGYPCKHKVDLATFELIDYSPANRIFFAKDKNTLFSVHTSIRIGKYKGYSKLLVQLKNSDIDTFTIINDIWAKDKNNVYRYGKIWKNIDATSFEFLFTDSEFDSRSYAKDKNNLYDSNGKRIIKGIDGGSFEMLNEYWGKDKYVVYNFKSERIMKNLDAQSFRIIGNDGKAEDKNYIFKFVPVTHNRIDLGHNELKKIKKK